ncbi:MAG: CvpA family protein [Duncaniella sp.]|nr:CvpA family protein [Duncaniella sp.]
MLTTGAIILLILLAGAFLWGCHKGFVTQLGAVAGLLLGVVACRLLGPSVLAQFPPVDVSESFPRHYLQVALVYSAIYIGVYLVVVIVTRLLHFVVKALCLGPIDTVAGGVVGLLKWGVPISLLLNLVDILWPSSDLFAGNNPIIASVRGFAPWLLGLLTSSSTM